MVITVQLNQQSVVRVLVAIGKMIVKKVGVTISIVIAGGLATKREGSSFKSVMSRIIHVEEVATATTQTTPTTSDQHCTSTSASASSYNPQLKHRHG